MNINSTDPVNQFISGQALVKTNGIIIFNALVTSYRNNRILKINSEVQILTLPDQIALYIHEFFREEYLEPEMYSTARYHFTYTPDGTLEISDSSNARLLILIEKI